MQGVLEKMIQTSDAHDGEQVHMIIDLSLHVCEGMDFDKGAKDVLLMLQKKYENVGSGRNNVWLHVQFRTMCRCVESPRRSTNALALVSKFSRILAEAHLSEPVEDGSVLTTVEFIAALAQHVDRLCTEDVKGSHEAMIESTLRIMLRVASAIAPMSSAGGMNVRTSVHLLLARSFYRHGEPRLCLQHAEQGGDCFPAQYLMAASLIALAEQRPGVNAKAILKIDSRPSMPSLIERLQETLSTMIASSKDLAISDLLAVYALIHERPYLRKASVALLKLVYEKEPLEHKCSLILCHMFRFLMLGSIDKDSEKEKVSAIGTYQEECIGHFELPEHVCPAHANESAGARGRKPHSQL